MKRPMPSIPTRYQKLTVWQIPPMKIWMGAEAEDKLTNNHCLFLDDLTTGEVSKILNYPDLCLVFVLYHKFSATDDQATPLRFIRTGDMIEASGSVFDLAVEIIKGVNPTLLPKDLEDARHRFLLTYWFIRQLSANRLIRYQTL